MFQHTGSRKHDRLARALERAAKPERPYIGRGPRYLVQPAVAVACAPSLRAIAAALRDDPEAFDDNSLAAIREFILDGQSTFFGRDETAAMREAVRLQHSVIGTTPSVQSGERIKPGDEFVVADTVVVRDDPVPVHG